MMTVPSLRVERSCWEAGDDLVCGMDEVGRGAWAGPVTVGMVIAPKGKRITKVRDSKMLSPAAREAACERITRWAMATAVGHASHDECDELGMTAAQRLAARRALDQLASQGFSPDRILLDGGHDYLGMPNRVQTIIKGDATSVVIAAASVLAKVTRDLMMAEESVHFPGYEFESNRGYPSPRHRFALWAYGPTAIHRRSWAFMDQHPWGGRLSTGQSLF